MKQSVLLILLTILSCNLFSQTLDEKLAGKINFKEIMSIVESHFQYGRAPFLQHTGKGEQEFENEYLHWKRWEYYNQSRLDGDGNIVINKSKRIWDAFENYKASNPQAIQLNQPSSSYSFWSAFGPTTAVRYGAGYNSGYGRVNCIAFHPSDANTLYVGTPQGGIWKTTNHGTSWFALTDDLPISGISGLVVDRTNANIIYALTGDGDGSGGFVSSYGFAQQSIGVLKSTDAGVTWQQTGDFPNVTGTFYGYKLVQHPSSAGTLFAATTMGIYKTTNSGSTWTQEQTGNFTDIEFKPGDPTVMYAAEKGTASPFWRSTNSGGTWSNSGITGEPSAAGSRIAIGVSANNAAYVYILAGPATGSGSFRGVYRSVNSGIDFSTRATTPNILGYPNDGSDAKDQDTYDLCIEVDPDNALEVITGGINIWRSTDGAASFGVTARTQWYDDVLTIDYVHADIHNLTYSPLNGRLYTCSDGGVGYSTDDGVNWTFIPGSLQILATYHADWYEADENFIACGTQDNGTDLRYTASNTYRHIYGADGFDCVIKDNDKDTVVFVANDGIHRTTNQGSTETDVSPAGMGNFPALARDFNNERVIFAGDAANLFKSTNFGASWSSSSLGLGSRVLITCPSNSDRLYCSDGSITKRSDNATASAASITYTLINGKPGYPTGVTCTDIASMHDNSLMIYACFGGFVDGKKVYQSTNGGDNWTDFSGSLPNVPCQSVVVDANHTVYVGTDVGVFVRATSMSDWQPFFNYLPKTPVSELMVNNTTGRIIACTFGRGNFYTDFYSTCPVSVGLAGTLSGYKYYDASSTVISSATVDQGIGNNVGLKAGSYVRLDPGAEIKNGSELRAWIGPCGTGGLPFTVQNINEVISPQNIYIKAANGVRYPYGRIAWISPQKNGANIRIIEPGIYSLRITNKNGDVVKIVFQDLQLSKNDKVVNWNSSNMGPGLYYAQLFKQNELVHFHEFEIK